MICNVKTFVGKLIILASAAIISGCSDVGKSGNNNKDQQLGKLYEVIYTRQIDVAYDVNSQVKVLVEDNTLQEALKAETSDKYSIVLPVSNQFHITNNCGDVTVNNSCTLLVSANRGTAVTDQVIHGTLLLPNGIQENIEIKVKLTPLNVNITDDAVLPLEAGRQIFITNTSTQNTFYFDNTPSFIPSTPDQSAQITKNTCISSLEPGGGCSFFIQSNEPLQGKIELSEQSDSLANVSFAEIVVVGKIIQAIPANFAIGKTYPFTYQFKNTHQTKPATGVAFENTFPKEAEIDLKNSSCNGLTQLDPDANCIWTGQVTPSTNNKSRMHSSLAYKEGNKVTLYSDLNVSKVVVSKSETAPLSANIAAGASVPFTYQFTNTSDSDATNLKFSYNLDDIEGLVIDEKNSSCYGLKTLKAGQTCTWQGEFKPTTTESKDYAINMTMSYDEGENVTLEKYIHITQVSVEGSIVKDIPDNTKLNKTYAFEYHFTNTNALLPATEIHFAISAPQTEGFTVDENNSSCAGITALDPGQTCSWKGTFAPQTEIMDAGMSIILSYKEGKDVILRSKTSALEIAIEATKDTSDIPANVLKGHDYPFIYSFTNKSEYLSATELQFRNNFPTEQGFKIDSQQSTCQGKTELKALETCIWSGILTPTMATGHATMSSTLSYKEGEDVTLTSTANVTPIVVTGEIDTEIGENTAINHTYQFTLLFTNTSQNHPATEVDFISSFPQEDGFILDPEHSSCLNLTDKTLPANSSCKFAGIFSPTKANPSTSLSVTLNYKEGMPVTVEKSTEVMSIPVTGNKLTSIPENVAVNTKNAFVYEFTNENDTLPATGITFTHQYSSDVVIDTAKSTCNGVTELQPKGEMGNSCTWVGTFTPTNSGNQAIAYTLSYKEGDDVTVISNVDAVFITITGKKVISIPQQTQVGQYYDFDYQFTNTNQMLAATGVNVVNNNESVHISKNDCTSETLAANHTCHIQGRFIPTSTGAQSVSFTLSYDQGSNVELMDATETTWGTAPISTEPENDIFPDVPWTNPRFTEAKDATGNACKDALYDTLTGLMWVKRANASGNIKSWSAANSYANSLQLCGYNDWRLPNINELVSLMNYAYTDVNKTPAQWLNSNGFTSFQVNPYWTSNIVYSSNEHWRMDFQYYYTLPSEYTNTLGGYVLSTRTSNTPGKAIIQNTNPDDDGPGKWPNPRFIEATDMDDGNPCNEVLYDKLTGLLWMKKPPASEMQYANAKDYVNKLELCGYTGWRFPSINELLSLVNYNITSAAYWLNANGFSINGDLHWSSTTQSANERYFISMTTGQTSDNTYSISAFILPVRAAVDTAK